MNNLATKFRQEVLAFCTRHKMSDRGFSTGAGLSVNFVCRLRNPSYSPQARTIDKARDFMEAYEYTLEARAAS